MKAFCTALWRWTKTPLTDWHHTTPVWREEEEDEDENDDVDVEEDDDETEEEDELDLYVPRSDDSDEETPAAEVHESDFEFEDL